MIANLLNRLKIRTFAALSRRQVGGSRFRNQLKMRFALGSGGGVQ